MTTLLRLRVSVAFMLITGPNHGSGAFVGYLSRISGEDRIETLRGLPPTSDGDIHARINSIPPGADIQVDGTYVGITPLEIDLPCCFHDVTISRRGRKPWTGRGVQQRPRGHQRPIAEISLFLSPSPVIGTPP